MEKELSPKMIANMKIRAMMDLYKTLSPSDQLVFLIKAMREDDKPKSKLKRDSGDMFIPEKTVSKTRTPNGQNEQDN